jgi:hypothetical protein
MIGAFLAWAAVVLYIGILFALFGAAGNTPTEER